VIWTSRREEGKSTGRIWRGEEGAGADDRKGKREERRCGGEYRGMVGEVTAGYEDPSGPLDAAVRLARKKVEQSTVFREKGLSRRGRPWRPLFGEWKGLSSRG